MEIFRVPQREVTGQVELADGRRLEGTLYTAETGADGAPGRLVDRLNDRSERFLPMREGERGRLVAKASIAAVRLDPEVGESEIHEGEHETAVSVHMALRGGTVIQGRLGYTMPAEKRRLLDFLNAAPDFVVIVEDAAVVLVNVGRMVDASFPE